MNVSARVDRARALRLVHHHPGRIRIRAEVFVHNAPLGAQVCDAIDSIPGVRRTTHRERTGSVMVEYATGITDADAILAVALDVSALESVVDETAGNGEHVDAAAVVADVVRGLDRATRELSGGRADLPLLVPAALAGAAVYSFVKDKNGPAWPRWDNLAWWAYTVFNDWHRRRENDQRVDGQNGSE